MSRKFWFSSREMVLISIIAAVSIISKPYVRIPFGFIQTTFGIPVGAVIGGIYMFWPVLVGIVVPKPGAVFLACTLQGLLAILTGFTGLLGNMAFFSYLAPGVVMEILYYLANRISPHARISLWAQVLAAAIGNVAGAGTNALLFFVLRGSALSFALASSAFSGALGGWLAYVVAVRISGLVGENSIKSLRTGESSIG